MEGDGTALCPERQKRFYCQLEVSRYAMTPHQSRVLGFIANIGAIDFPIKFTGLSMNRSLNHQDHRCFAGSFLT